jgi:hypothetical protein
MERKRDIRDMTQDPLKQQDGAELFHKICQMIDGAPLNITRDIAVSLLINAIRQTARKRSDAEGAINEIFGRAKHILLDIHYDSVTGKPRAVFPYTQTITPPLHIEPSGGIDPCGR